MNLFVNFSLDLLISLLANSSNYLRGFLLNDIKGKSAVLDVSKAHI
jgi:hypothetical protein